MGNNLINGFVFAPPEQPNYTKEEPDEVIFIQTKNKKKIPAYFLKNPQNVKTTILYSHGNAADIGAMYEFLRLLAENLPVNVLHYEYIGYGLAKSEGSPSEAGVYESVEAAFTYLNSKGIKDEDIIIFGTSVGSGPSCQMASKRKIKGLILECPFVSIVRIVSQSVFGRIVDMFENINKIDKVEAPVLIFHGRKDDVVPFDHGKELYEKVQSKYKYMFVDIPDADHHDIIEKLTLIKYIKTLYDFVGHCEKFQKEEQARKSLQPEATTTSSSTSKSLFTSSLSN